MSAPSERDRARRVWPWAALSAVVLLLAALGWSLLLVTRASTRQETALRDQVLEEGRFIRSVSAGTAFRPPGSALVQSLGKGPVLQGSTLRFRHAALFLGRRLLWSEPAGAEPPAQVPPLGLDLVETRDGAWFYLATLEDGRLFQVGFDAPAYERLRAQRLVLAAVLGAVCAVLLIVAAMVALRLRRLRMASAGWTVAGAEGLPEQMTQGASAAFVNLFQQTLGELRRRTDELEALHRRERSRAEDVEGMAEALFANLEAGYLRFDQDGRLAGVNAAARALMGLQQVPRLGDRGETVLSDRPEVLGALEQARASRSLVLLDEVPGVRETLLQVVAIPLLNRLHQSRGHLLVLRDLTPDYQMRRTLREREALSRLGEVAAGVAHEVRNALNTLSMRLRLLGQDVPAIRENPQFAAVAQEAANLEQVVNDLLFLARPLPPDREPLVVAQALAEAGRQLGHAFPSVEAAVECPEELVVLADPEALGRCLHNLVRNAGEAIAKDESARGKVRLTGLRAGESVEILVEDDGPGVPEEARDHLFTPFFSQKPGGTGLGLAIARKIAREHGGDLVYCDSGLGGAGFLLTLPAEP